LAASFASLACSQGIPKVRFCTLDDWLKWQQALHPHTIELGLERVGEVARRMDVLQPPHPVITVAGTNGKGSCVAILESILIEAGYKVGSYMSPHLLEYNERVRVQREAASDDALCRAFELVDAARHAVSLSYFEFGTLAAMHIFAKSNLDVAIMEVGLGGRLDAVNLQDPDVALITSIDLDHTEWLGHDREAIGFEKAGIMRAGAPAVCGDPSPPTTIAQQAATVGARLYQLGRDFSYQREDGTWTWRADELVYAGLPLPALQGEVQLQNASTVLMALAIIADRLPVDTDAIRHGLKKVTLAGRFQRLPGSREIILDIAHNPAGAKVLASTLSAAPCCGRTLGVFAVLADKDAAGMVGAIKDQIDCWYVAANRSERAMSVDGLEALLRTQVTSPIEAFAGVEEAFHAACYAACDHDRVVVFGSAFTVAEVLALHV
jgi:dihydrofolate synthase/folylpolyglutamate synthase